MGKKKMLMRKFGNGGVAPTDFFAHYQFEETSGITAYSANNDKPITAFEGTMWNADGYINRCVLQTIGNTSFFLDNINSNLIIDNNNFSCCFWFNSTVISTTHFFIERGNALGTRTFRISIEDNQYRILVGDNLGVWKYTSFTGVTQPPINTWTHLAVTFSTSQYLLYENGVLIFTANYTDTPFIQQLIEPLYIGGKTSPTNGKIDEVYIYDRILTSTEINQIKNIT